jgi:hypothetical protein
MRKPTIHNLNLSINDYSALNLLEIGPEIDISINFGNLTSISHLDNSVLVITFQNGELRLDLSHEDVFDREPFCALCHRKIQVAKTRRSVHEE